MVASIAADAGPDDVTFVLIDYKGGATFDACRDLPHTVGVVTDLDERLAARAIRSLDAEIRRRERALRDAGAVDLADYRRAPRRDGRTPLPRLVVVIDEFAALAVELPTFLSSLVGVAQRGRSLGIHLVLATQRPAGVVSDDIRANTNIRIALRLNDRHDAIDVVGERGTGGAATIAARAGGAAPRTGGARDLPDRDELGDRGPGGGTGARRLGGGGERWASVTQRPASSSRSHGPRRGGLAVRGVRTGAAVARAVATAAHRCRTGARRRRRRRRTTGRSHRRSGPPTPPAAGLARRRGSLLVVGATGSGTTSALVSVVVAAAPSSAAIYVVDARGDAALASLGALPACAGVVGLHDAERRGRVVRHLTDELARRRGGRGGGPTAPRRRRAAEPAVGTGHARRRGRARRLGAPDRRGGGGRHPLRGDRRPAGRAVAVGAGVVRRTVGAPPRRCRRRRHRRPAARSRARGAARAGRRRLQRARGPARRARAGVTERGEHGRTPWSRSARSPPSCTRPPCPRRAAWTVRASSASGSTSSPSARRR